jgi:hypothetical protein
MLVMIGNADVLPNVVKQRGDLQQQTAFAIQTMDRSGLIEDLQRDPGYGGSVLLVEGVFPAELEGRADHLVAIEMFAAIPNLPYDFG